MATVPVHDMVIHPREHDLVAGTYGRGIWITDIAMLRELGDDTLDEPFHVFDVEPRPQRGRGALGNYHLYGDRYARTPNEPETFEVLYWLKSKAADKVRIDLSDASGKPVRTIDGPGEAGLNRIRIGANAGRGGRPAAVGEYTITVTAAGATQRRSTRIRDRIVAPQ
jgi:hypothetical protein